MCVWVICSELQNILLLNLVWWCSIMKQSVMQKTIVCCLQGQGHSIGSYNQIMTLSTISCELLILKQLNLFWWHIIISQSVLWKNLITYCIQGQGHSKGWKCQVFLQLVSSKPPNILLPNLVLWFIFMSQSVMQKDWIAIFKVKVTARVLLSEYDSFYYVHLTADPFASKLGLMVYYCKTKPECRCVQGQGHSRFSKCHRMFVQIFWIIEPFTTKFGMVMHPHELECLPKRFCGCLQGQGHSEESYNQNMTNISFWTADPFAALLVLLAHHHELDCFVKRLDCSVVVKVKVTGKFKIPVNVHLDNISSTAEPFVIKLGMVMHHRGPGCHTEDWFPIFKFKVTWRLVWSDMTISTISTEPLIFFLPDLIGWYFITSWSVLCKFGSLSSMSRSQHGYFYYIF